MQADRRATVAILMASFDGAAFVEAQLASIAVQTHRDWHLAISDDGSRDGTRAILADWQARLGSDRIRLAEGPGRGATANFLSLIAAADRTADFVAFADQDDVWDACKMARAIAALAGVPGPALYGTRTRITGPALEPRGLSPRFRRATGFRNALVQSIAGGNTMMMNRAAHDLACTALDRMSRVGAADPAGHDWWLYQLVSGAGGRVIFDPRPALSYRQHGGNVIGANRGLAARGARVAAALGGRYARWNSLNMAALMAARDLLTPAANADLDAFAAVRARRGPGATLALVRAGLYRQTLAGNASLLLAAWLGRL
jgi:glycosyltransferase involved in cell wall biosynthesis